MPVHCHIAGFEYKNKTYAAQVTANVYVDQNENITVELLDGRLRNDAGKAVDWIGEKKFHLLIITFVEHYVRKHLNELRENIRMQ